MTAASQHHLAVSHYTDSTGKELLRGRARTRALLFNPGHLQTADIKPISEEVLQPRVDTAQKLKPGDYVNDQL